MNSLHSQIEKVLWDYQGDMSSEEATTLILSFIEKEVLAAVPEKPKEAGKTRIRNAAGNLEMKYTWNKCRQETLSRLSALFSKEEI